MPPRSCILPLAPDSSRKLLTGLPPTGFTLDVVQRLVLNTALNPVLSVPLFLLAKYTQQGQGYAIDYPTALRRLKLLMYLGLARWTNNFLSQGAQNNWKGDRFDWDKAIVLITGMWPMDFRGCGSS
jgi:all-trans-retinol dehydrogenase (NAD+)